MGRIGYGNSSKQEYSLDEPGYIYVLTNTITPEFPSHIKTELQTLTIVATFSRNSIFRFVLTNSKPKQVTNDWGF